MPRAAAKPTQNNRSRAARSRANAGRDLAIVGRLAAWFVDNGRALPWREALPHRARRQK